MYEALIKELDMAEWGSQKDLPDKLLKSRAAEALNERNRRVEFLEDAIEDVRRELTDLTAEKKELTAQVDMLMQAVKALTADRDATNAALQTVLIENGVWDLCDVCNDGCPVSGPPANRPMLRCGCFKYRGTKA